MIPGMSMEGEEMRGTGEVGSTHIHALIAARSLDYSEIFATRLKHPRPRPTAKLENV